VELSGPDGRRRIPLEERNRAPSQYASRYHRDGTVTYWSVYQQSWVRLAAEEIADEILATLPESERLRIARMAASAAK
jgi:hypothetical protein